MSSLNIWVNVAKSLFSRYFFQVKTSYEHYKEDCSRLIIVHEITASGTLTPNLCNQEEIPKSEYPKGVKC